MTQEDHYLSTDSGTGLYFAIPQLPADRQECGKGVMLKPKHPHPLPPHVKSAKSPSFHPSTPIWDSLGNVDKIECSIVSANAV